MYHLYLIQQYYQVHPLGQNWSFSMIRQKCQRVPCMDPSGGSHENAGTVKPHWDVIFHDLPSRVAVPPVDNHSPREDVSYPENPLPMYVHVCCTPYPLVTFVTVPIHVQK